MFTISTPEEVFDEFESIWPLIYGALDHALQKNAVFFEHEDTEKRVDRALAPNLVRWWAKQYLEVHGQQVVEVDANGNLTMEHLSNNGLCLHVGRGKIRILKSVDGQLPIPGYSQSKQEYYSQANLPFPEEEGSPIPLNLVLLWDVTQSYKLSTLSLAYPMAGDTTRASVKSHWHEPIPETYLGRRTLKVLAPEEETKDLPLLQDLSQYEHDQSEEIG